MTSKDMVLEVLPDAEFHASVSNCCVLSRSAKEVLGIGNTEEEAWDDAWACLEKPAEPLSELRGAGDAAEFSTCAHGFLDCKICDRPSPSPAAPKPAEPVDTSGLVEDAKKQVQPLSENQLWGSDQVSDGVPLPRSEGAGVAGTTSIPPCSEMTGTCTASQPPASLPESGELTPKERARRVIEIYDQLPNINFRRVAESLAYQMFSEKEDYLRELASLRERLGVR